MCVHCGFNLQTGQSLDTSVGRAVKTAHGGARRAANPAPAAGFIERISRSWEYVKISYSLLWDFKQLLVFPFFSLLGTLLVLASFVLPLWGVGTLEQVDAFLDEEIAATDVHPLTYAVVFAFYFCTYFVIVFFNTALAACALRVCAGETPTIGYGLSVAMRRLPQVVGWALLSASIGLLLKIIENAHEKAGTIIAAVLGTAWSVMTFFVVPVLAAEGVGPLEAFKRALAVLKKTWGEALVGNFSMGILVIPVGFVLALICGTLIGLAVASGSVVVIGAAILVTIGAFVLLAVSVSAADMVFRSLLYNYATGQTIPEDIDETVLEAAFGTRPEE